MAQEWAVDHCERYFQNGDAWPEGNYVEEYGSRPWEPEACTLVGHEREEVELDDVAHRAGLPEAGPVYVVESVAGVLVGAASAFVVAVAASVAFACAEAAGHI